MKFYKLTTNVTDNGMTEYVFESTVKVTEKGTFDKYASVTGGTIFAEDANMTDFNESVSVYCSRIELERAKDLLSSLKSELEERREKGLDDAKVLYEIDSLERAIASVPELVCTDSPVAKVLAFAIAGYNKCRFATVGYDCITDTGLIALAKECYQNGNTDSFAHCKSELERFLTAHLKMSEDIFCKNITVKFSMNGNGGKRASFINWLNASFSKTYRYTGKGITGKSANDRKILQNMILSYFENVLTFAGQVKEPVVSENLIF